MPFVDKTGGCAAGQLADYTEGHCGQYYFAWHIHGSLLDYCRFGPAFGIPVLYEFPGGKSNRDADHYMEQTRETTVYFIHTCLVVKEILTIL